MARSGRRRSRITAGDLAGYGSVSNGTVDIDRAARGLGASKTEVRQAIRQAEAVQSNTFFRRMSGRGEADVAEGASTRGMLQAAFGRGPRGGAVNAKAAAQSLGVSPGTVRRWAAGTQRPSPGRLAALRWAARRSTTTKRGRRAATSDFRSSAQGRQALRGGSKIWVSGEQGVGGYDQGYARGAVNVAAVAAYAGVSPSTMRRWIARGQQGNRRKPAIPKASDHPAAAGPGGGRAAQPAAVPARTGRARLTRRRPGHPPGLARTRVARPAHRGHHRDPRKTVASGCCHQRQQTCDGRAAPPRHAGRQPHGADTVSRPSPCSTHAMHRTTFPFAVTRTAPRGSVCTVMVNAAPAQSLITKPNGLFAQTTLLGRPGIAGPDG